MYAVILWWLIIFIILFTFLISLSFLFLELKKSKKNKILNRLIEKNKQKNIYWANNIINLKLISKLEQWFSIKKQIDKLIKNADINISTEKFFIISFCTGILFCIPWLIIGINFAVTFIFIIIGLSLPTLYILYLKRRREETILTQLPDAVDMIIRSLRAGQSVDNALKDASRMLPDPLGPEIKIVFDEINMGIPFDTAFRNMEKRLSHISDIKIFCTAFIVQRETGGNITDVLENLSKTIRQRLELKLNIKALTSEGKASAIIIALIPLAFGFITWLVSPGYIATLFYTPLGKKILFIAILLDILGCYIMKKILKVDV